MELRHLTYAVAVADAGTFTQAARECHVAQSALSKQVGQLEAELGARLFRRTTRRVELTAAGGMFIPAARQLLAAAAAAAAEVRDLAGVSSGRLLIGATQTATRVLDLPAALGRFHHDHPQVGLSVQSGPRAELLTAVAAGELDIALTAAGHLEPATAGLRFHVLRPTESLVAVVATSHPLAQRKRVSLADLARHGPFIEFRRGTELRRLLDERFQKAGIDRTIAFELGELADLVSCAVHDLGVAVVPKIFTTELQARHAAVLTLREPQLGLTIGAYTRYGDSTATTRSALNHLTEPPLGGLPSRSS